MKDLVSERQQNWRRVCGKAVELCGSQAKFRIEANILRRLVKQFGCDEVERMIHGAQGLGWRSLKSLGSADGAGRRWALEHYWRQQNSRKSPPQLESLGQTFKRLGLT